MYDNAEAEEIDRIAYLAARLPISGSVQVRISDIFLTDEDWTVVRLHFQSGRVADVSLIQDGCYGLADRVLPDGTEEKSRFLKQTREDIAAWLRYDNGFSAGEERHEILTSEGWQDGFRYFDEDGIKFVS